MIPISIREPEPAGLAASTALRVDDILRRLRAGLGNALIWGGAWFVGSMVLLTIFVLLGLVPTFPPLAGMLRIATRFGLTGIAAGAGFSGLLRYAYRGERLSGIRSAPFILGGALIAGVISPLVGGTALIAALLGGATAGATLVAAKSAERGAIGPGDGPGDGVIGLGPGDGAIGLGPGDGVIGLGPGDGAIGPGDGASAPGDRPPSEER